MSVEKAARRFKREMQDLGLGVTITVPGREPVVVTEPPQGGTVSAVPVRIPQQLSFDIGGEVARPTGASFTITGKGAIRNQLLMGDDIVLRVVAADGEIVGEFEGTVANIAFERHEATEQSPEWVERAHTIKLGERVDR